MALFDSVRSLIHDTAQGLIDAQVTTKVSDMVANFVSSGLTVTNDTLKIVRDITVPPPPPPPGP
ncbi:MAG TPA: hypothetical protein VK597_10870 [Inquilinus sp.]|jgi:hypothetical protein|nr:hypothetical protein [Inquilinus sp.]